MQQNKQFVFRSNTGKFVLHTSAKELKDLLVAWIFVSLAFAIAQGINENKGVGGFFTTTFLVTMIIAAITVGIAFLFHELAHKIVAQQYRCWAEFRADLTMLGFGILISLLGVIFIAPGAVMIFGDITTKQNGKISLAGPFTNIIIALILLPFLYFKIGSGIALEIITSGFIINAWLALFNMIPLWNFDGAKIYRWSKPIYFIIVILAALLVFIYFMRTA